MDISDDLFLSQVEVTVSTHPHSCIIFPFALSLSGIRRFSLILGINNNYNIIIILFL